MDQYADLTQLLNELSEAQRELGFSALTFGDDLQRIGSLEEAGAFYGFDGNDTIGGTDNNDAIGGGPGNDRIQGFAGDDTILGGTGNDLLLGSEGRDRLIGNAGDDTIVGNQDRDLLFGDEGNDKIIAGAGNDRITPGSGNNFVRGGEGNDALVLDGLVADYTIDVRDDGVIFAVNRATGERTVATQVEFIRDDNNVLIEATADTVTFQLLHATDFETDYDEAANFAAVLDALEEEFEATLFVSSGDNYLPGGEAQAQAADDDDLRAEIEAALTAVLSEVTGEDLDDQVSEIFRADVAILNALGLDASAVGNHEFDLGPGVFADAIAESEDFAGALFPYLSANLDVGPDSPLFPVFQEDGLDADDDQTGVLAPYAVFEEGGESFGVIGLTTPRLAEISNPGEDLTSEPGEEDLAALAEIVQASVDELQAEGVNKIILTSHLQSLALERELATLVSGVDVIIAGGSDAILADEDDRLREDDEALDEYPLLLTDAAGGTTAIVSTDGQFNYVGRLVAEFDLAGNLVAVDDSLSGPVPTDEQGVLEATGADDLESALAASDKADQVGRIATAVSDALEATLGNIELGAQEVDLNGERADVRTQETNLGNLTADANKAVANALSDGPAVQVSLKNGGGIRASIENDDGVITALEISESLRFDNGLTLITLTPEQLLEVLEHAVAATTFTGEAVPEDPAGQFAQVGGVRFSYDPTLPAGERVQDVILTDVDGDGVVDSEEEDDDDDDVDGVLIVSDGELTEAASDFSEGIRVVTLNFLLGGGDGYPYPEFIAADPDFADVESVNDEETVASGDAQFANEGGEQDALAEFLLDNFPPDGDAAFDVEDTPADEDTRIVNLAVEGVEDLVL